MKYFAPLAGIACLLAVGCGDSKADTAINRVQSKPNPGYVRIVNLTSKPIEFWHKNRHVSPTQPGMDATDLLPIGTGDQTVRIEQEGKKIEVKVKLSTNIGTSVVLYPDLTTKLIENEQRYATADSNVRVMPIDDGGTMPATVKLSGADSKTLTVKDSLVNLNQGSINLPDGTTMIVKEKIAYTLFIVAAKDKVHYILSKNASDKKPIQQGAAAA